MPAKKQHVVDHYAILSRRPVFGSVQGFDIASAAAAQAAAQAEPVIASAPVVTPDPATPVVTDDQQQQPNPDDALATELENVAAQLKGKAKTQTK
jgi:hypothetical protein